MTPKDDLANRIGAHSVQLYRDESELGAAVALGARMVLAAGGAVVHVCTPRHAKDIHERLRAAGVEPTVAELDGRLQVLSAEVLLARIMGPHGPDARKFRHLVGEIVDRAAAGGERPVHIFGEMVDLLWSRGDQASTLALERMWEELRRERHFTLHCAFTIGDSGPDPKLEDAVRLHSHIVGPSSAWAVGTAPLGAAGVFLSVVDVSPESTRRALRSVSELSQRRTAQPGLT